MTTATATKSITGLEAITQTNKDQKIKCVTDTLYYGATFQRMADGSFTDLRTATSIPMNNDFLKSKFVVVEDEPIFDEVQLKDALSFFVNGQDVFFKMPGDKEMTDMVELSIIDIPKGLASRLEEITPPNMQIKAAVPPELTSIPVPVLLKAKFFIKK